MGCSSCIKARDYDEAKELALKLTELIKSDVRIFKEYLLKIGYTYGIEPATEKLAKRRLEIEIIRFREHKSKPILQDISREKSNIIVPKPTRKNNSDSGKRNSGKMD